MKRLLVRLAVLRGALRAMRGADVPAGRPDPEDDVDPTRYEVPASPRNEAWVAGLLVLTGVGFAAFGVLLVVAPNTQLLGLALGLALVALAVALVVAGKGVVPQETAVEERIEGDPPEEVAKTEALLGKAADGVSRRRLLVAAAGATGTGAVAAAGLSLTALGPSTSGLDDSPWRDGVPLVTEDDEAVTAAELEIGSTVTAFPRGADKRELGSPVAVVRWEPAALRLPKGRDAWAPEGIMAYSKICTHAGCAVSLYRKPTFEAQSEGPALVCPCHYSTFDVTTGAQVIFGPAGRPLPQLPLRILDGALVAAGPLSGSVGPAWWGTRRDDL